jgi:hypothetical protein
MYFQNGTLMLYRGGYRDAPRFFFGPCVVRVEGVQRTRTVTFGAPSKKRLELTLSVFWDPRLKPVRLQRQAAVLEARDDRGADLLVVEPDGPPKEKPAKASRDPYVTDLNLHNYVEPVKLLLPPSDREMLAVLRGEVAFLLARSKTEILLESPVVDSKVEAGGFEVTLKSLTNDQGYQHLAEFKIESSTVPLEQYKDRAVGLEIFGKGGERMWVSALQRKTEGALFVRCTFQDYNRRNIVNFDDRATPEIGKVVLTVVNETVEHRIPFEFRDLKIQ